MSTLQEMATKAQEPTAKGRGVGSAGNVGEGAAPAGKEQNPANPAAVRVTEATRIPMSLPRQQLETPEIPGFVQQWFADRPGKIAQALQAGYEFVSPEEVRLNQFGLASDVIKDGNTDLGSRVSIHGGVAENGGSERLYLMKIRKEWWDKDQQVIADRNEAVAEAIRGGMVGAGEHGESRDDAGKRYVKRPQTNMFTKRR